MAVQRRSKNAVTLANLVPRGYTINHNARPKKGGGVGLLTKSSFPVKKVNQTFCPTSFEFIECVVQMVSVCVRVVVLYRPPSGKKSTFMQEFADFLEYLAPLSGKLLIAGDFNLHVDQLTTSETKQFMSVIESHGLLQHVSDPTHTREHILDLILTRSADALVHTCEVSHKISDHYAVHICIVCGKSKKTQKSVKYRKLGSIDVNDLQADIQNKLAAVDWSSLSAEECVNLYNTILHTTFEDHAPTKQKTFVERDLQPWINEDVLKAKRVRRKYERQWRRTRLTVHRTIYKDQCEVVQSLVEQAKAKYYQDIITECNGDQGKLFNIVNNLLGRGSNAGLPNSESSKALANTMSEYFVEKIANLRDDLAKMESSTKPLSCPPVKSLLKQPSKLLSCFSQVSEEEVEKIIRKANKTSCKLDPIPTKILNSILPAVLPVITAIVNKCLSSGEFPKSFKSAIVRPLLKQAGLDVDVLKHYRPVSNLSFLSKVVESVIASQLRKHLEDNDLLEKMQSAYRAKHSTETAMIRILNDLLRGVDKKSGMLLILLDLSAAFDTVDHQILLQLLEESIGVNSTALALLKSYLSDRSQTVTIDNIDSELANLVCGVPQGSVLGPLKFCMYTLPIGAILKAHGIDYHIYADDTQVYLCCNLDNVDESVNKIEGALADVRSWMIQNKLKINDQKTQFLVIKQQHLAKHFQNTSINIGNSIIHQVTKAKNLGVILDQCLTMNSHVSETCRKCFYHLRNISAIRKYLSQEAIAQLIHSLVTSRLDYCNAALVGVTDANLKKLQRIQNVAARILTCTPRDHHITPVLFRLHWLPVEARILFKILMFTFKAYHKIAPSYINELVHHYNPDRSLRSSAYNLLEVPRVRLKTYGDRAFSVVGPTEWNKLPASLRSLPTLSAFKSSLKTYLFRLYFADYC